MKYDPEKLKAVREARNLTQRGLHLLTKKRFPPKGVSHSVIRDFECGRRPGTHSVPKIAAALGMDVEDFLKPKRRTA